MIVNVVTSGDQTCHRCLGELYLTAVVPHPGWGTGRGGQVRGRRTVGLCPRCDADSPAAQSLLAYFAIHGRVQPHAPDEFAVLLQEWVDMLPHETVDPATLDEEIEAWRGGML